MGEVKAIITLRSGKEVDQPMPKPVEESRQGEELQPEHILLSHLYFHKHLEERRRQLNKQVFLRS